MTITRHSRPLMTEFKLRAPRDLIEELHRTSARNGRTASGELRYVLRLHLEREARAEREGAASR